MVFTLRTPERLSAFLTRLTQELRDTVLPYGRMDAAPDLSFPLSAKAIALLPGMPDEVAAGH